MEFNSKNLGMKVQKKLVEKMASKKIFRTFIDGTVANLLDILYKIAREFSDKETGEKLLKDIIKIVIKVGILYRNEQFNEQELKSAKLFLRKFHDICMTVCSFYEVDYSFDKTFLSKIMLDCSELIKDLIKPHLTEKTIGRVDNVFNFFGNPQFLETVYKSDNIYRDYLQNIVKDLRTLMEEGLL